MQGFWATLPRPFFVLAPLANVTDVAFRRLIATYSKPYGPDVMYTEFVSADGLIRGNREVLIRDLAFSPSERPIVAQFFTSSPEAMEEVATLASELGFDGVDINMGCPDRAVEKQGAGAALMKDPKLACALIEAAQRGAGELPVSLKTRLGYNTDMLESWLPALFSCRPAAIVLHARTRKDLSSVPARWERIRQAVEIRDGMGSQTLLIGNGDVSGMEDARQKAAETGVDGVMLGRAIFGRPWLFDEGKQPDLQERLRIACEHAALFEELLGDIKSFAIMKKHFKAYVEGFPGAKELRATLMETKNASEVREVIETFLGGILKE